MVKAEAITVSNSCLIAFRLKVAPAVMLDAVVLILPTKKRERERDGMIFNPTFGHKYE